MDQSQKKVSDLYLDWLSKKVERREHERNTLYFLADLHGVPFYSLIPNDENREHDGLVLRDQFADENGIDYDPMVTPCSLLEMLVALADRMNHALYEPVTGDRCEKWFWLFIENLRLEVYDCDDPYIIRKRNHNYSIITLFLDRHYGADGRGGLFPLKRPREDQTNVEIWYQMMAYLEENFPI